MEDVGRVPVHVELVHLESACGKAQVRILHLHYVLRCAAQWQARTFEVRRQHMATGDLRTDCRGSRHKESHELRRPSFRPAWSLARNAEIVFPSPLKILLGSAVA